MPWTAPIDPEAPLLAGPLELRPRQRALLLHGVPQKLGARAFDLLEILMREADRPHPKRELLDRVWPDVVVADNNLEVHIWALRKALGAGAILTVPGRGYRFALAAQPGAAPASPLPSLPTGLPARLPPLLGRADELLTLGALVDTAPLVTVVGGGGVGKTLLVHHLLHERHSAFEHGVCWVDLSTLDEQAAVAPGIAAALGIGPAGARPGDVAAGLAAMLAPLSLLLAIDNAEHRIEEVMHVAAQVVAAAPQVHIVVTSQAPLQARGERVFRLGPLAVPNAPILPADIPDWGALALFDARVRALDRHFTWTAATVELARTVCLRLDGAPLAIELAAARVPLLGLAALATALDEPLAVLTRGPGDAPVRQRSLRAALEWSHALLNADERIVFRRMAAFSGGSGLSLLIDTLGADDAEADADPVLQALDRPRLLDALNGLVERSLVATSGGEGEPRLRLLEAPRALARERLAAAGEGPALERRHAQAVCRHICRWHGRLLEGAIGHDTLVQALESDLDNTRAALRWALEHDAAIAVALARPLSVVLTGARWDEGDFVWAATERCVSPQQDAALRAGWLLGSASFRAEREARLSEQHASAAAALYRALGDEQGEARALAYVASSRLDDAAERQRAAFERMQSLVKPHWPPATLAAVCRAECLYAYRREDFDTVEAAFRRWLAHSDGVGNAVTTNAVAMNLADLALARGRAAEAVQLSQAPLARLRGSRDRHAFSILCMNLSAALLACDRIAEARAIIAEAWPLAPALSMQSRWLDYLALLAALEGRYTDAAALLTRADADYRAKGERRERHQQRSHERAAALAAAGLDAAALERARAAGRCLSDREAGELGLAPSTSGP